MMRFPNLKGTQVLAHGPKTPAVARLEASGRHKKHSPSLATLKKCAEAVGCRLDIRLISR